MLLGLSVLLLIPDCDVHSPAFLDLFLAFDLSIYSVMTLPYGICILFLQSILTFL